MARYLAGPKRRREVQIERQVLEQQRFSGSSSSVRSRIQPKKMKTNTIIESHIHDIPTTIPSKKLRKIGKAGFVAPTTSITQLPNDGELFAANHGAQPSATRRRCPNRTTRRSTFSIETQQPVDEDRFYVIEKILNKRFVDDREEYLVRWQNYPPEWDSWEPRIELERNALDMINEYNRIREPDEAQDKLHCICKRPYRFDQGGMIQCNNCLEWFHFKCLAMNMAEANAYAKWNCHDCFRANPNLKNLIKPEKQTHPAAFAQ